MEMIGNIQAKEVLLLIYNIGSSYVPMGGWGWMIHSKNGTQDLYDNT